MAVKANFTAESEPTARIFISYSRKDMGFADRLARGFEPFIDREGIYAFEDWWRRLQALIAKADTVVFVLSPDSVTSRQALKEVEYAAGLNKRFAPIVCRPVNADDVPAALRRLNFIFCEDPGRLEAAFDQLAEALRTNIEWIRLHTEYGEAARRWSEAGRPSGLLLRSPALEQAENWIASRPRGASEPTENTRSFVAESRRGASRRRNIVSGSLAAGLIAALALAGLAYWQRDIAVAQGRIAKQQRDSALLAQSRFLADRAEGMIKTGDAGSAALLALEALNGGLSAFERPYLAQAENALFDASQNERELAVWRGEAFALSPDGRWIVIVTDGTAVIRDSRTQAILTTLDGHLKPTSLVVTPDGQRIAMTSDDIKVWVWDAASGQRIATLPEQDFNLEAFITPNGERAVTDGPDGGFMIWDLRTAKPVRVIRGEQFVMSADGRRIIVYVQDSIQVWDVDSGAEVATLDMKVMPGIPAFSSDGRRIVAASDDRNLHLWDADTGKSIAILAESSDVLTPLSAFSPDGKRLLITPRQFKSPPVLWNAEAGKMIAPLSGQNAGVFSIVFSPDGTVVATIEPDMDPIHPSDLDRASLHLWDSATGEALSQPLGGVSAVRFSPDGTRIAIAMTSPPSALLCVIGEGSTCVSLAGDIDRIADVRFSRDSRRLATSSRDGTVRLWDSEISSPNPPAPLIIVAKDGYANCSKSFFAYPTIVFSRDDQRAITLAGDEASIWDVRTLRCVATLTGHADLVTHAAFSADGRRIVTASFDKTARVWDAGTGAPLAVLAGHEEHILDADFSPDGRRIVTAAGSGNFNPNRPDARPTDTTVRVWDTSNGAQLLTLAEHRDSVRHVQFSADGGRILTSSDDHTARIWNASTGRTMALLEDAGASGLHDAIFSPDGNSIAIAFEYPPSAKEKGARIFDGVSGRLLVMLDTAENIVKIVFSADGKLSATVSGAGIVRIWNANTGGKIADLPTDRVWTDAVFSANSERIALRSDNDLVISDIASGRSVASLKVNATFTFDNRLVEPVSTDGLYRIWRKYQTTDAVIGLALRNTPRCLTKQQREEAALNSDPVEWCIENEKWPYDTAIWKEWLSYKKLSLNPPMPGSPSWAEWLREHRTSRAP